MAWKVEIATSVQKQFKKFDKQVVRRILKFLKEKVEADPRSVGKPLQGKLAELWRYRVGDYRLICEIQDSKLIVLVLKAGHRREAYREIAQKHRKSLDKLS